jgi:hypothetical protein
MRQGGSEDTRLDMEEEGSEEMRRWVVWSLL